jgi:hypothetical protein
MLIEGCTLAVEYKGARLAAEAEEKWMIGQLWANASEATGRSPCRWVAAFPQFIGVIQALAR